MVKSVDPDQTAPAGSALLAAALYPKYLVSLW